MLEFMSDINGWRAGRLRIIETEKTMYIQLNGQVLSYEKEGEGRPIILLHGNGESHKIFDVLTRDLSRNYTVYAIDSRGHGGSATPKEYHYNDMADDVIRFIEALSISQPLLCGFSDGGIIALLVAMRRSNLLSSIVVCGANLTPRGLTGATRRQIKSLYRRDPNPRIQMMLLEPSIQPEDLAAIHVPAMICAGSDDMVKPKETQTIATHIPQSELHIFEGATHGSYVEHSGALAPVIRSFYPA